MSRTIRPSADWRERALALADQPPTLARLPLLHGAARIGSVEPGFFDFAGCPADAVARTAEGFALRGPLTESLARLAYALRAANLAHEWRDEQLAVRDESGRVLGTVERAAVRPLGIATYAVHLAGVAPDGRHWVQRRSLTKPNDPGLWDTLMGGMVPASDTVADALARETWEEAGLRMAQLADVRFGGSIATRRPSDRPGGYVVERIDWYRCVVPEGVVPVNQDGEVDEFRLMAGDDITARLERGEFTLEAALVLMAADASAGD